MAGATHKARASPRRKPAPVRRVAQARNSSPQLARVLRGGQAPQAKLKVGAANDPAEREADVVAARALSAAPDAASTVMTPAAPTHARLRRSAMEQPGLEALDQTPAVPDVAQDVEVPDSEDVEIGALDDTSLAELEGGASADAPAQEPAEDEQVQARRAEDTEEELQTSREEEGEEELQTKQGAAAMGPEGGDAPSHIAARVTAPGPGRPLPRGLRRDMEGRFGTSFEDVRLHDGPQARDTVGVLGARAFAHGSRIWMGPGESPENKALMAHELTHVVQQTGRQSRLMPQTQGALKPSGQRRQISRFIDDAVLEKIDGYARNLPGYLLISVLMGKSPVTGKEIARTPGAVIGGLLGLIPGASILVEQLGLVKAMDDAYAWVLVKLSAFDLTWSRVKSVVARAREAFSLLSPIESLRPVFKPLYDSLLGFARAAKDKIMEFIVRGALRTAGPFGEKVWGILQQAGDVLVTIALNPLAFAKNLILAVMKGFGQFLGNILKHLKKGLLGFVFGSLQGLDIDMPEKLDLKGVFSLLMQILGLTWKRIRALLVKKLGRRGERIVAFLEKTVDIIKLLVTDGVMGIWQKVLGFIEGLKSTVIGGLIEFVTVSLAKAAMGWLAGLSNPVGWIVKIVLIIYDFIVLFLERMQQIAELAASIFGSVAAIAAGKISAAANKVEEAIGRTVPLVLAFLAAIIPVTGIASKIRKIFQRLRKPVENALKKLVAFIVKKAKKLLAKIIGRINKGRKLPGTTFKIGKKVHKLFARKKGKSAEIYVQSVTDTTDNKTDELRAEEKKFRAGLKGQDLKDVLSFIIAFEKNTDDAEKDGDALDLDSKKKPQTKKLAELKKEIEDAGIDLTKYGILLGHNAKIETEDERLLLRFKDDVTEFEGATGLHSDLSKRKNDNKDGADTKAVKDRRILELDHNPNLAALRVVRDWLEEKSAGKSHKTVHFKKMTRTEVNDDMRKDSSFGRLSMHNIGKGPNLPAMAIFGPINTAQNAKDKVRGKDMEAFLKGKDLRHIPTVKAKIREQMAVKSQEINDAYKAEPKGLVDNVARGNQNIAILANDQLNLEKDAEDTRADLDGDVSNLARALSFSGNTDGPDFLEDEGAAGKYSSIRKAKSKAKYLEADHNPTKSDMRTMTAWKLSDIAGDRIVEAMKAHRNFAALPPGEQGGAVGRLDTAMATPLRPDAFGDEDGGAMIISARINQHKELKDSDTSGLARALDNGRAKFTPEVQTHIVNAAIAGRDPDRIGRRFARIGVLKEIRAMIRDRQDATFALYAKEETKAVREINTGPGEADQAVGLLARIAARIRSGDASTRLGTEANAYFPR